MPTPSNVLAQWNLRLAHDNTFLSYHRNAIIATVAGGALVQYQRSEGRTPLAGTGLLCMGGLYMYIGSALNIYQAVMLRRPLGLGLGSIAVAVVNAAWPVSLWSISLACLLDETPSWLLDGLRKVESHLPNVVHNSLFLDGVTLYPVCRLIEGVVAQEKARLATVHRQAAGHWSLMSPTYAPLTCLDVATIITRRLERLEMLQEKLDEFARCDRAVPTALCAPVLERLRTEIDQLASVLDAATSPSGSRLSPPVWWVAAQVSSEHRRLLVELDDVRRLGQRIAAVRFTSTMFAARGQVGVAKASKEEEELTAQDVIVDVGNNGLGGALALSKEVAEQTE